MATKSKNTTIPAEGKHMSYDGNGGYEGYYDGRLICAGQWWSKVESELDQYVTDLIADDLVAVADDAAEADAERCPICDHRPGCNDGMPLCPSCTERVYGPLPGQFVAYAYDDTAYDDEIVSEARDIAAELGLKLSPENMRLAIALAGVLIEFSDDWNDNVARAWSAALVAAQRPACRNCTGAHETQRCPEVMAALFV